MKRTCVIVADAKRARFFDIVASEAPRVKFRLAERTALTDSEVGARGQSVTGRPRTETNTNRDAGPVHPVGAQRERHRLELESRFGNEIAGRAGEITRDWKAGVVVLVADPHMLGLVRESVRSALPRDIELKELAKDYTRLSAADLVDELAAKNLVPAVRRTAQ